MAASSPTPKDSSPELLNEKQPQDQQKRRSFFSKKHHQDALVSDEKRPDTPSTTSEEAKPLTPELAPVAFTALFRYIQLRVANP